MTLMTFSRRRILGAMTAAAVLPVAARATQPIQRNLSSFAAQDWRDHFDTLGVATIVADTGSRALHFWSGDGTDYRIYPTSVPISEDLTRRGYTEIVRKRVGPDWTPTQSQRERFGWEYMPPGPENPPGHPCHVSELARLPDPRHP